MGSKGLVIGRVGARKNTRGRIGKCALWVVSVWRGGGSEVLVKKKPRLKIMQGPGGEHLGEGGGRKICIFLGGSVQADHIQLGFFHG